MLDDINATLLPNGLPSQTRSCLYPAPPEDSPPESATVLDAAFMRLDASGSGAIGLDNFQDEESKEEEELKRRFYARMEEVLVERRDRGGRLGRVAWFHGNSLDDELSELTGSDVILVVGSFALLITLCHVVLFSMDPVHSKTVLGLGGTIVVAISVLAAYGLCIYAGIMFSTLTQILPFILLGVGLDDIFVLVLGLEEVTKKHPEVDDPREKVRMTLETFGMSITTTSVTNLMAFGLGSITGIPSVRAFCIYAAVAIVMDYLLQISLFVALISWNIRRERAQRYDVLCCLSRQQGPSNVGVRVSPSCSASADMRASSKAREFAAPDKNTPSSSAYRPPASDTQVKKGAMAAMPKDVGGSTALEAGAKPSVRDSLRTSTMFHVLSSWYMHKVHVPLLRPIGVRLLITLSFLLIFVFGTLGSRFVKQGITLSFLTRPDSDVGEFFRRAERSLDKVKGVDARVYVRDVDFASESVQATILDMVPEVVLLDAVNAKFTTLGDVWLYRMVQYAQWMETMPGQEALTAEVPVPAPKRPGKWTSPVEGRTARVIKSDKFYPVLKEWSGRSTSEGGGTIFVDQNMYLNPSDGTIETASFSIMLGARDEPEEGARQLKELKEYYHAKSEDLGGRMDEHVFIFNGFLVFDEGELILKREVSVNIAAAMCGVFAVTLVSLIHPWAAVLCTLSVVISVIGLFGVLWASNTRFNSVSAINLVMAVGLSVDYNVHMALHFVTTVGPDRVSRMATALEEMGPAVLLGSISTLVALMPLSASNSNIFQVFFLLMSCTMVLALTGGLLLIPSLMGLVGPQATKVSIKHDE